MVFLVVIPTPVQGETMRQLLVGQLHSIVTNPTVADEFITFVKTHRFTELTFYTGGPLVTRVISGAEQQFSALLMRLPAAGVTHYNIAIGSFGEMDRVQRFIDTQCGGQLITGLHLEYEWWNNKPRDFENAKKVLNYMRQSGDGNKLVAAYIGWTTPEEMAELIPLVDRILIHAYVPDGTRTYSRVKARLDQIRTARPPQRVSVYPLFSAEWLPPELCDKGPKEPGFYDNMCFMGPWLKANGGVLGAERAFNTAVTNDKTKTWTPSVRIDGYSYYSHVHLKEALKD
jgi:hypothetical protein